MKSFRKFVLTILLTLVIVIPSLVVASRIFIPKWVHHDMNMMTFIIKGFYKEKKDSLDVIIGGNSDTYRGISPMVMYNEYGFTSYNFVSAGQRMWHAYALFEDAIRLQNPKVYAFNVDGVFSNNQSNKGNSSKVYDNMPLSSVKIKSIFDPYYKDSKINRIYHILPIFSYHSRYSDLSNDDFKYAFYDYHNPLKGVDMVAYQVPYNGSENYMKDNGEKASIPSENIMYLNKMKDRCKEEGIEFLLFHIPSSDSANYARYSAVKEYADKNNLVFVELNLLSKEIGIDWKKDTSDGGDHLNIFGAHKVSKYFGKYLVDNYDLPNHKNDKAYDNWNKDYQEYLKAYDYEVEDAKKNKS